MLTMNEIREKLEAVAEKYGVHVLWNCDAPENVGKSFMGTLIRLPACVCEDEDKIVSSFFHELGHQRLDKNIMRKEIIAWQKGFDIMLSEGFEIKVAHVRWCLECLLSYVSESDSKG